MSSDNKVVNWRWTLAIGVVVLIVGAYILQQRIEYFIDSVGAVGVITDIQEKDGLKSGNRYFPIVEFKTQAGEIMSIVGEVGSSSFFDYEVGTEIDVRYSIANPEAAKLSTFQQMWLLPFVLLLVGLLFIAAAIYNYKHPPVPQS